MLICTKKWQRVRDCQEIAIQSLNSDTELGCMLIGLHVSPALQKCTCYLIALCPHTVAIVVK